jgi:hypothetical protein
MAEGEGIDIKRVVKYPLTGIYWIKTLLYGLGLATIFFIGFGVYKAYFRKPLPSQAITVQEGGKVLIQQNQQSKKILTPFVEVFVAKEKEFEDLGYGMSAGLRFEF